MMRKARAGFTLVELLVTLTLVVVLVSVSVVNLSFMRQSLVQSELEKLYAFCGYVQQVARATNQPQTLFFDVEKNRYEFGKHRERLNGSVKFGVPADVQGPPSAPTDLIESPVTFTGNMMVFNSTGTIKPGTIYLMDKQRDAVYALTVPVGPLSYMRKYRYDGTWRVVN